MILIKEKYLRLLICVNKLNRITMKKLYYEIIYEKLFN